MRTDEARGGAPETTLQGWKLRVARAFWLIQVILTFGIWIVGSLYFRARLQASCPGPTCPDEVLTLEFARELERSGLSVQFYLAYTLSLSMLPVVVGTVLGTLIYVRRPDDRMALLISLFLITSSMFFSSAPEEVAVAHPALWLLTREYRFVPAISLFLCCYLFPDGRFVPRWTRWVTLTMGVGMFVVFFFPGSALDPGRWLPDSIGAAVFFGALGSLVFAQVYRYRRWSTPAQRQQSKWVVSGIALAIVQFVVVLFLSNSVLRTERTGVFGAFAGATLFHSILLIVPCALSIAILRSRLWDIDIIIRRTLVYSLLSASLALVYLGSVVVLQRLLAPLAAESNQVAVVASTLAIAALFQPLRRRIQTAIDRRFYRRKYDAARTLQAFNARVRDQVELSTLTDDVQDVVRDTLQPTHVSLWLRPTRRNQQPAGEQLGFEVDE